MALSPPTLPPGVKTDLLPMPYVIKTYGLKGYQDNITFYFRNKEQGSLTFQVGSNDPFNVDGRIVEAILYEPATGSPDVAFVYPGIDTTSLLILQTLGKTYSQYSMMKGSDTPFRLLERIAGNNASLAATVAVDESVAAAGTGSSGSLSYSQGDLITFSWGISQDTLGTSPHDSYIGLYNGASTPVLLFRVRGAVNPYGTMRFIMDGSGSVSISWKNGDSVAHWFVATVTVNSF